MRVNSADRYFCLLGVASLLIWGRALYTTLALAIRNDAYTHILLVLPVSIALIILDRRRQRWITAPGIRSGSALLTLAAVIGIAGLRWGRLDTTDVRLTVEMLALVTWWVASFVVCFGAQAFRRLLFPLLFLLWLIPIPQIAVKEAITLLQTGTASLAREMFALIGVPVTQQGTVLTVPGLTIRVAEECSSIRSSMMLIVTSTIMSYLLLRSLWGKTIVILAAMPLSIAKNGLRVFTLTALASYRSPAILDSPLHHQGGPLFLAIALAALTGLIALVSRMERMGDPAVRAKLSRMYTSA